jgi:hypothetical protein
MVKVKVRHHQPQTIRTIYRRSKAKTGGGYRRILATPKSEQHRTPADNAPILPKIALYQKQQKETFCLFRKMYFEILPQSSFTVFLLAQNHERNKINIWLRSSYTNLAVKTPFPRKKLAK